MGTVYIFRTNQMYKKEDLKKTREELTRQIKDGLVVLNADMEFVMPIWSLYLHRLNQRYWRRRLGKRV